MANFSGEEINDAKRRVEEMRQRAKSYVDKPNENEIPITKENTKAPTNPLFDLQSLFSSNEDSSFGLILAIILILSKEGADNKLILALLYILL